MARRGSKKLRRSSATGAIRRFSSGPTDQGDDQEPHLPSELLEMIFSRLELVDNIRASAVCKTWLFSAISIRKTNIPPWLMFYPKSGNLFEFYDPSRRKHYYLSLPELIGTRLCYAKDNWLLVYNPRTSRLFFFCPYTREKIKMPKLLLDNHTVCFTASPKNPDCTLFTIRHCVHGSMAIYTCKIGDRRWTITPYVTEPPFDCSVWNKLLFCKGRFYFMTQRGYLGIYEPADESLTLAVPPPRCTRTHHLESVWKNKFMAEHDGDIYVVYTCDSTEPFVYKLDQEKEEWKEVKSLNGTSIFATNVSSCVRTDLVGKMAEVVCFPKVMYYGKRCVTYSPKSDKYYPRNELHDWGEVDPFKRVWIEAPKDVEKFLEGGSYKGKAKKYFE